jgi:hypothetical protein
MCSLALEIEVNPLLIPYHSGELPVLRAQRVEFGLGRKSLAIDIPDQLLVLPPWLEGNPWWFHAGFSGFIDPGWKRNLNS